MMRAVLLLAAAAFGADVQQLEGRHMGSAPVQERLRPEDERALGALEAERDQLMLLVEEMETAGKTEAAKPAKAGGKEAERFKKDYAELREEAKKVMKMKPGPKREAEMKKLMEVATLTLNDDPHHYASDIKKQAIHEMEQDALKYFHNAADAKHVFGHQHEQKHAAKHTDVKHGDKHAHKKAEQHATKHTDDKHGDKHADKNAHKKAEQHATKHTDDKHADKHAHKKAEQHAAKHTDDKHADKHAHKKAEKHAAKHTDDKHADKNAHKKAEKHATKHAAPAPDASATPPAEF